MANLKNTSINDAQFRLPVGDTATRPNDVNGQIRFNSQINKLEIFNNAWTPIDYNGITATGGDYNFDQDINGTTYRYHIFTNIGTSSFSVLKGGEVEYLIVAGGGGSGSYGGGGGGGLITGVFNVGIQSYDIIVGDGGTGSDTTRGESGTDSSAFGLTAVGGGGGGGDSISSGGSGGSGGGGNRFDGAGGSGTAGQGSPGGNTSDENGIGSGGGGAGEAGENGSIPNSGNGGNGLSLYITGIQTYFAGGGGAGSNIAVDANIRRTTGGLGGGGAGGFLDDQTIVEPSQSGLPNTGGGAGGAGRGTLGDPANGGSGIVILRYPLQQNNPIEVPKKSSSNLVLDIDFGNPSSYDSLNGIINNSNAFLPVTGTITGSVEQFYPKSHRGFFDFTGNNNYISLDHSLLWDVFDDQITVEVIFESTQYGGLYQKLVTKHGNNSSSGTNDSCFQIQHTGNTEAFRWSVNTESGNYYDLGSGVTINLNQIYHFVGVYNGSTGRMEIYVDGVLIASRSGTGPLRKSQQPLVIGAERHLDGGTPYESEGRIYLARLYDRDLTPEEIENNFSTYRWRFGI